MKGGNKSFNNVEINGRLGLIGRVCYEPNKEHANLLLVFLVYHRIVIIMRKSNDERGS